MDTDKIDQNKKVDVLYADCKYWISTFKFTEDEIVFITKLLESYVFEPNTPNLFERLQDYLKRIKQIEIENTRVKKRVIDHENKLGGMLECVNDACDLTFYNKHNLIKAEVNNCNEIFKVLKAEIFNYAGGILKSKKP
tara:strand:+ start:143150 stop:143563 length:414 start_codon:yes stop_codon:yes gene_type:complete